MDFAWAPFLIAVYGVAGIVCAIMAWVVAIRKRRDRQSWAFASFFLPPAVLILLWLKPLVPHGYGHIPVPHGDDDDDGDGDGHAVNTATRITGA